MKAKKTCIFIFYFLVFFQNETLFAELPQPLRAIQEPTMDQLRLVESFSYCYARQGTQKTSFQVEGTRIRSQGDSNSYVPTFQPAKNSYIGFGCVLQKVVIDFYLIDDSFRFDQEKKIDSVIYNSVDFHQDALTLAYSFRLVPHRLYFDLGGAYAITEYNLGRYGSEYTSEILSDRYKVQTWLIHGEMKVFLTHFFYLGWRMQQSLNSTSFLRSTNQLGINMITRF